MVQRSLKGDGAGSPNRWSWELALKEWRILKGDGASSDGTFVIKRRWSRLLRYKAVSKEMELTPKRWKDQLQWYIPGSMMVELGLILWRLLKVKRYEASSNGFHFFFRLKIAQLVAIQHLQFYPSLSQPSVDSRFKTVLKFKIAQMFCAEYILEVYSSIYARIYCLAIQAIC